MEQINKSRVPFYIGLAITMLASAMFVMELYLDEKHPELSKHHPMKLLESKLYDYRFRMRGPLPPPEDVVIATIDEKSIDKLGRWPWNRDKWAEIVNKLNSSGAGIIVFDVIFSEREKKNDPLFGKSIREAGNVILPVVFDLEYTEGAKKDESSATFKNDESLVRSSFYSVTNTENFKKYLPIIAKKKVLLPVPELLNEAMAIGHINMTPDDTDGTLRWESLAIQYGEYIYPSVTLKAAALYLGIPPENMILVATEGVRLGKRFIPTNMYGRLPINFYGTNETFPHISIADILDGKIEQERIDGKIILIGATAVGIYDLRVTPFSPAMAGVEKHASVIASMIEERFIRSAPMAADMAVIIFTGVVLTLLIARMNAFKASLVTGTLLFITAISGYLLFSKEGIWLNMAYPLLNIIAVFINVTAYNFMVEELFAKQMKSMFSSYVTERVVNELIKNPQMAKLGGERREITVLFSDVRGFTSLSERHSPEEVVAILNEYLGAMTEVIFKWEGTLDKFIGDAILAFWNAPMKQDNHAELAVRCSLEMLKRLDELKKKWESEGKMTLDCGIGINTGEVLVGNIGAEGKKMDYTVIGDHVNLGSRVEGLTRKYDTHIIITEYTLHRIKELIQNGSLGHMEVAGLERVVVKGKKLPVAIYSVASLDPDTKSRLQEEISGPDVVMTEK